MPRMHASTNVPSSLIPTESRWKKRFHDLGIVQKQIAYACGISPGYLSDILNGWRPTPDNIELRFSEIYAEVRMMRMMDGAKSCNQ